MSAPGGGFDQLGAGSKPADEFENGLDVVLPEGHGEVVFSDGGERGAAVVPISAEAIELGGGDANGDAGLALPIGHGGGEPDAIEEAADVEGGIGFCRACLKADFEDTVGAPEPRFASFAEAATDEVPEIAIGEEAER